MTGTFCNTIHIVRRVKTETGSRIEPPLEQSWTDLEKLQWHAAVASYETGSHVEVMESETSVKELGRWRRIPNRFDVLTPGMTIAGLSMNGAWDYINGFTAGRWPRNHRVEGGEE